MVIFLTDLQVYQVACGASFGVGHVRFCLFSASFFRAIPYQVKPSSWPLFNPQCQGTSGLHRLHHRFGISVNTHSYSLHSLACLTQIAVESLPGGSSCSTVRHHRCIMHHGPESVAWRAFHAFSWMLGTGRLRVYCIQVLFSSDNCFVAGMTDMHF